MDEQKKVAGEQKQEISIQVTTEQEKKIELAKERTIDERFHSLILNYQMQNFTLEMLPDLAKAVKEQDITRVHFGMIGMRKLISIDHPPIQRILDTGLVPHMIELVKQHEYPQLQMESAWTLTNIASGSTQQCTILVQAGMIPTFIDLLRVDNMMVVEQAVWALGCIGADNTFFRDQIISEGGAHNLLRALKNSLKKGSINNACWALSNLARGIPLPRYQSVKEIIETFCKMLSKGEIQDEETLGDCFWAIANHTDSDTKSAMLKESKFIAQIIKYIASSEIYANLVPSIRILGNATMGNDTGIDLMLEKNVFSVLLKMLQHHRKAIRRQTCWLLSNMAAGSEKQVSVFIGEQQIGQKLLSLIQTDSNDVRKEICYILANFSEKGNPKQVHYFYQSCNVTKYFLICLKSEDRMLVNVAIKTLKEVLLFGQRFAGKKTNQIIKNFSKNEGVQVIFKLMYHEEQSVRDLVQDIFRLLSKTKLKNVDQSEEGAFSN